MSGRSYTTVASVTTTSHTDTGLTNGVTYFYVVTASNASGESGNSPEASATPHPAPPPAPANLTAAAGNQQVTLNWSAAPGAVSYNLKRGTTSGAYDTLVASSLGATSYVDSAVVNGTTYYYVVTAVNGGGESPNSNQASATPAAALNPVLEINSGGGSAGTFVADTGFNGGQAASTTASIDLSGVSNPAPQAVYQTWRTGVKKSPNFSYTLTGLAPNSAYSLRLHFAENSVSKSGARKFDVTVNGVKVLSAFDVFAAAGGKNKALVKAFPTTADAGGQIVVSFTGVTTAQHPIINGIEVDQ